MSEDYRSMWKSLGLEDALKKEILVPENPQMVGALGAASLAGELG